MKIITTHTVETKQKAISLCKYYIFNTEYLAYGIDTEDGYEVIVYKP